MALLTDASLEPPGWIQSYYQATTATPASTSIPTTSATSRPTLHLITAEDITNFSHESPTKLIGLLILGGFLGLLFFFLTYWLVRRRSHVRSINRHMQRGYLSIEQPQSPGVPWLRRPPPSYEQSQGGRTSTAVRSLERPQPLFVRPLVPETEDQQRSSSTEESGPLHRVSIQRDQIIQMEREQTLMRLEGNPLGGHHTSVVPEQGLRDFIVEMKLQNPARTQTLTQAEGEVKKPEPLRLRGGGRDLDNSPGSADDILRRIKEWVHRQKSISRTQIQKEVGHQESDSEHGEGMKDGILARMLRKRAEAKREQLVRTDREFALRKLEGRV